MGWEDAKPSTPILSPKAHVIGCSNLKPLLSAKGDSGAHADREPRRQLETEEPSSIRYDDARPLVPRGLEHCAKAFRRKVLITRSKTRRTMTTSTSNTDGLFIGRRCGTLSLGKTLKTSTTTTTTRSWNVNGLLDGLRCCTLFWEKTLNSPLTTTTWNWKCRRSARRPNPVQRENLDDLHQKPKPAELEC